MNPRFTIGQFIFDDGLEYKKDNEKEWTYCTKQDRRFYPEINDGVSILGDYNVFGCSNFLIFYFYEIIFTFGWTYTCKLTIIVLLVLK